MGFSQINTIDLCEIENQTFQANEQLTYKIYYNWGFIWIPAGEVVFDIQDFDDAHYAVHVTGRNYRSYERIFRVRDDYYSKIGKSDLLPVSFLRDVLEGNYMRYDSIQFDQINKNIVSFWGDAREDVQRFDFEVEGCMQDMVSVMYFVRNIDFAQLPVGSYTPVDVFFDKEVFNLGVEFAGVEKKKKIKGMGKCNTLKIVPDMVEGHVFEKNSKMEIWLSNDQNRIPLLIQSPLIVGSVKAVLIEVKGLKFELTSVKKPPTKKK